MCGRLLKLWHALQRYGYRVAGRDEETLGGISVDRYTLVERRGCLLNVYMTSGKRATVFRGPGIRAWLRCPAGV